MGASVCFPAEPRAKVAVSSQTGRNCRASTACPLLVITSPDLSTSQDWAPQPYVVNVASKILRGIDDGEKHHSCTSTFQTHHLAVVLKIIYLLALPCNARMSTGGQSPATATPMTLRPAVVNA